MDPITAWALAIKAVAEMITELSRGQSDAVKQEMWTRFAEDTRLIRDFFKL